MISDINNISGVKPEDYNYKEPIQMIDDDPIEINNKKNKENPFELARKKKKNNSLNVSDSKNSNLSRKSDLSSYGRLSIRMKNKLSRSGYDEDILIDFSSRHTAYLFSIWFVFIADVQRVENPPGSPGRIF